MTEMRKLDHLEERPRAIEGGKDYAFANLEELFLVPNIITPPKCFAGVYHQLLALQWHIRAKARSRLDCGGEFHVSPPRFERHVHDEAADVQ